MGAGFRPPRIGSHVAISGLPVHVEGTVTWSTSEGIVVGAAADGAWRGMRVEVVTATDCFMAAVVETTPRGISLAPGE